MSAIINLTGPQPVNVSLSSTDETRDQLHNAVDIGRVDRLDLELVIVSNTAATGTALIIGICTGMQNETEDGWLSNCSTPSLNFAPVAVTTGNPTGLTVQHKSFSGMLRWVRWVVRPVVAGTSGSVSFYIRGMARGCGG